VDNLNKLITGTNLVEKSLEELLKLLLVILPKPVSSQCRPNLEPFLLLAMPEKIRRRFATGAIAAKINRLGEAMISLPKS